SVGAGTGTGCLGYKGGIGSSSRVVEIGGQKYTVGVLVQTNFGGRLTVNGVTLEEPGRTGEPSGRGGSCVIVAATDAPLGSRNLKRLARRCFAGMARTGADFSNGSGDYAISFSTHPDFREVSGGGPFERTRTPLSNEAASGLFLAAAEATEEAIVASVLAATTMRGRDGHVREALDIEKLKSALRRAGK
ncbi:MAG: P1 family peptidase, partial [Candidatus Glassbacteria bacterium]